MRGVRGVRGSDLTADGVLLGRGLAFRDTLWDGLHVTIFSTKQAPAFEMTRRKTGEVTIFLFHSTPAPAGGVAARNDRNLGF